jgi:hypothetical protein
MEAIAYYDPGADITCQHTAGAPGGRFVSYPVARNAGGPSGISDTGDGLLVVTTPAANAMVFGVTSNDVAAGGRVDIMRPPKVVAVESGGAASSIAVGDYISTDNTGKAVKSGAAAGAAGRALTVGGAGTWVAVELFSGPATSP